MADSYGCSLVHWMLLVDCPWFSLACGSYAPDLVYGTRSIEISTHGDRFTCVHMYGLHILINIIIHSSPVHNLFMNCSYVVHDLVWMFVRWVLLLDPNSWFFVSVVPMQDGSLFRYVLHQFIHLRSIKNIKTNPA